MKIVVAQEIIVAVILLKIALAVVVVQTSRAVVSKNGVVVLNVATVALKTTVSARAVIIPLVNSAQFAVNIA